VRTANQTGRLPFRCKHTLLAVRRKNWEKPDKGSRLFDQDSKWSPPEHNFKIFITRFSNRLNHSNFFSVEGTQSSNYVKKRKIWRSWAVVDKGGWLTRGEPLLWGLLVTSGSFEFHRLVTKYNIKHGSGQCETLQAKFVFILGNNNLSTQHVGT